MRNARGATFAASLTSKLADSALLGYLRYGARFKSSTNKKGHRDGVLFVGYKL